LNEKSRGYGDKPRQSKAGWAPKAGSTSPKMFNSHEIFEDAQEIVIEHEGDRYRLRRTSKGKLILTK
jgi:hemin uptake protein HemP